MTPVAPANFSLEVTLALRSKQLISGAAIPVVVTLRNTTPTGGAFVHSPEADMPFIFVVEPEKGEKIEISRELYQQRTMPNPPPPREQEMAPLRAGASLEYALDLASWLTTPLKPGRYKFSAVYVLGSSIYRSASISAVVVAPRARLLEVAPSGNRLSLGAVMVHVDEEAGPSLYQRESESGSPGVGTYIHRRSLHNPSSVAISTDGESATEPRWLAWTEGAKASFLHVWAGAELFATQPAALTEAAGLVSPGWTFDDQSVLFLAATGSEISLITIQNREQPRVRTFAIGGGIANPQALRAGFFKTQSDPPARRLLAVWPAANRLMASLINPEGEAAAARELARRDEPLVAVDIEAVGREGAPIIHAVFAGAHGEAAYLVRVRAGEDLQTSRLPALPASAAGSDLHWTVLAGSTPAVAVQASSRIFAWTSGSEWQSIYESQASHLRLAPLERPWAIWADSADGLHYRELSR